jgi:hypothetical protein
MYSRHSIPTSCACGDMTGWVYHEKSRARRLHVLRRTTCSRSMKSLGQSKAHSRRHIQHRHSQCGCVCARDDVPSASAALARMPALWVASRLEASLCHPSLYPRPQARSHTRPLITGTAMWPNKDVLDSRPTSGPSWWPESAGAARRADAADGAGEGSSATQ